MSNVTMKAKLSPVQGGRLLQKTWDQDKEIESLKARLEVAELLLLEHVEDFEDEGNFDEDEWHERVVAAIEHRLPQTDEVVIVDIEQVK